MLKRTCLFILGLTFISIFTACITRGTQFSSDYSWIQQKKTTKMDVRKRLGEPYHVGYSSGRPSWTYGFYNLRVVGDSHTKELTIYWQPDGKVDSFTFRSNFPDDRNRVLAN